MGKYNRRQPRDAFIRILDAVLDPGVSVSLSSAACPSLGPRLMGKDRHNPKIGATSRRYVSSSAELIELMAIPVFLRIFVIDLAYLDADVLRNTLCSSGVSNIIPNTEFRVLEIAVKKVNI